MTNLSKTLIVAIVVVLIILFSKESPAEKAAKEYVRTQNTQQTY